MEFVVVDNGSGIAAELQPRIFDPFVHGGVKLNVGAGQLGCGLTIVRCIAAIHGGSAELRRSTPQGSYGFGPSADECFASLRAENTEIGNKVRPDGRIGTALMPHFVCGCDD